MVNRGIEHDLDLFLEGDKCMKFQNLIEQTGGEGCGVDEFLTGDSDLPVCVLRWMMIIGMQLSEEVGEDQQEKTLRTNRWEIVMLRMTLLLTKKKPSQDEGI